MYNNAYPFLCFLFYFPCRVHHSLPPFFGSHSDMVCFLSSAIFFLLLFHYPSCSICQTAASSVLLVLIYTRLAGFQMLTGIFPHHHVNNVELINGLPCCFVFRMLGVPFFLFMWCLVMLGNTCWFWARIAKRKQPLYPAACQFCTRLTA